ncbi:MAG TPA: TIGR00730 family Rossman fold protein [Pseudolabrys sp.]|nr:TIGR00730 family Rossman fold protein [Pseudolabrys sp.]
MSKIEKPGKIRKICVYCGSSPGTDPAFEAAARAFGAILANNGIHLVFGGGAVGIMGAISKSVLDHGGTMTGIIPEFLVAREHAVRGVGNLIVTRDMHERKRKMFELADAFVALPGGVGTLEEVVEQITWVQLGRHRKPILLANIKGFWDPLCALISHMKKLEFIRGDLNFDLLVADKVADILPMLQKAAAAVPAEEKEMPGVIADRL